MDDETKTVLNVFGVSGNLNGVCIGLPQFVEEVKTVLPIFTVLLHGSNLFQGSPDEFQIGRGQQRWNWHETTYGQRCRVGSATKYVPPDDVNAFDVHARVDVVRKSYSPARNLAECCLAKVTQDHSRIDNIYQLLWSGNRSKRSAPPSSQCIDWEVAMMAYPFFSKIDQPLSVRLSIPERNTSGSCRFSTCCTSKSMTVTCPSIPDQFVSDASVKTEKQFVPLRWASVAWISKAALQFSNALRSTPSRSRDVKEIFPTGCFVHGQARSYSFPETVAVSQWADWSLVLCSWPTAVHKQIVATAHPSPVVPYFCFVRCDVIRNDYGLWKLIGRANGQLYCRGGIFPAGGGCLFQ